MFWMRSLKGELGGGGGGVVAHGSSTVCLLNIFVDGGKFTFF